MDTFLKQTISSNAYYLFRHLVGLEEINATGELMSFIHFFDEWKSYLGPLNNGPIKRDTDLIEIKQMLKQELDQGSYFMYKSPKDFHRALHEFVFAEDSYNFTPYDSIFCTLVGEICYELDDSNWDLQEGQPAKFKKDGKVVVVHSREALYSSISLEEEYLYISTYFYNAPSSSQVSGRRKANVYQLEPLS